ncbi:UvrD-helicase domain-containing protein [Methanobrevibacter sp.]
MRESSVFTFLKSKYRDLYDLCTVMEKLIVNRKYNLAMAAAKVILDLFSRQTKRELVLTIDVFNDPDLTLSKRDIQSVHEILFTYIYRDYFEAIEEYLKVDYEYDFTFLGHNPKITNEDIFLIMDNLEVNSIAAHLIGREGEDLIKVDKLNAQEKTEVLERIKNNLDEFIKKHVLSLKLFDSEGNPLSRPLNFQANQKANKCVIREIPPEVNLDPHQESAVEYTDKPLVINAGPGAGKTRVIIERVCHLLNTGVDPKSVLVITFTNKAADELRERFKKDTKLDLNTINQMRISTIHSFCRQILRDFTDIPYNLLKRESERNLFFNKHKEELGFKGPAYLRNYESNQALKKYDEYALFEVDSPALIEYIESKYAPSQEYLDYIDEFYRTHAENQYPSKKEIKQLKFKCDEYKARYLQIAKSYPEWIKLMEREHVCDQNYLLIKALEILSVEDNLNRVEYKNILIDEFQDTDAVQMQIFELLKSKSDTYTVVGDADQSIYSFRAANPKFFNDYFQSDEFEKKILVNNYRSTSDIVDFNEKYIKNKRSAYKNLKTVNESKMPVYLLENDGAEEEYRGIAFIIKNLKDLGKITKYSDVCVLFRSHKDKKEILDEFKKENIPYYLKGIDDLIYQDEVKAVLALFWYMLPFNPTRIAYYGDGGQWINLSSFTDKYYEASKIFKLSSGTMDILNDIELKYHANVVNIKNNYEPIDSSIKSKSIMDVVRDYSDEVLEEIFKRVGSIDISSYSRDELKGIGITDEHDLDFFEDLNELKASLGEVKLTSLQIFYELLKITGYTEELLSRNDFEAKKAALNLALISEVISDYENIMGKYDLNGLFNYLYRSLKYYSCPINEEEDNSEKVHIMTVHKAKGLEYPVVITASIKDRSFPLVYSSQRKDHFFNNNPVYPTPNRFLKYKISEDMEADEFNREEERVVYVANTRAEELLILSVVLPRAGITIPKVLKDYSDELIRIEPSDVGNLKKVTSHIVRETNLFNQIEFEDILEDYLFCPLKYNLENNLKFKNPKNINKFIDSKLRVIVNRLHNDKLMTDWDSESIEYLVSEVIHSYSFASGERNLKELFNNFTEYWREYGSNFDVVETGFNVTLEVCGYDINGSIDLIIRDGDGVSLVHFIRTRDEMRNYHSFYMELLSYYAIALRERMDIEVENLILYVLDEAKLYETEFKSNDFIEEYLSGVVDNISGNDYARHTINCDGCEFYGLTCQFKR